MNFFDIDPIALPDGVQYFFNILVRIVSINPKLRQVLGIEGVDSICFTEHIMDARPYILYIDVDEEVEFWQFEEFPHCVVEVAQNEVSWYDMLDCDTGTRWRIDTEWDIEFTPEEDIE